MAGKMAHWLSTHTALSEHQYHTGHERGDGKAVQAELGYYVIYDNNESSGWAAYLNGVTAKERHHETTYNGRYQTDCRTYT